MNVLKKVAKALKVLLINLCLFLLLFEFGSLAFYYWKTGQFFYTRNKTADTFARNIAGPAADRLDESIAFQLHPFFGYTFKPGSHPLANAPAANNYGFVSVYDYPFKRENQNQFIIGVFGGSLAHLFTLYELEHKNLTLALRQLPHLQHKEIIFLNFGGLGYKQPQQAIILNYFVSIGQDFDLVINLDGFNEIAFSILNNQRGVEISLPCSQSVLPLLDIANEDLSSEQVESAMAILHDKDALKKSLVKANGSRFASSYILAVIQIKYYSKMLGHDLNEFSALGVTKRKEQEQSRSTNTNRVGLEPGDESIYNQAADTWANSSISMKNILSQRNTPYLHFIEPNQYYATARKFTDEEKRIAFNFKGGFAQSISQGYPILLSRLGGLRAAGVDVFSAVNVFDNIAASVYADECCHYNNAGNEALSQYVSVEIRNVLSGTSPRPLLPQ